MEKYKKWTYIGILTLLCALAVFLFLKYALGVIFPFAISFLIVSLARPLINKMCKGKKSSKPAVGVIVISVILITVLLLIYLFTVTVIGEIGNIVNAVMENLSKEDNYIVRFIGFLSSIEEKLPFLKQDILGNEQTVYSVIVNMVSSVLNNISVKIGGFLTSFVSAMPEFIITLIVIVLSLFYFSKDYDKIGKWIADILPEKIAVAIPVIKKDIVDVIGKFLQSYLILMLITFTELFCGFLILGIKNCFVLSVLIAFIDILPVLGVGTVLIPWSVILLVGGNTRLGIGLLVMCAVIYVVRQFAEPRIVSAKMNVHPLITLFFMFAGLKTAGIGGMIISPLIVFVIKTVYESVKKQKCISTKSSSSP